MKKAVVLLSILLAAALIATCVLAVNLSQTRQENAAVLAAADKALAELENQLTDAQASAEALEAEKAELEAQLSQKTDLEAMLTDAQASAEALATEKAQLQTALTDAQASAEALEAEKAELQTALTDAQASAEALATEKSELQTALTDAQASAEALATEKAELQTALTDAQASAEALATEKAELQTALTDAQASAEALATEKAELQAQLDAIDPDEAADLASRVAQLEQQLSQAQESADQQAFALIELRSENARLQSQLDAAPQSSLQYTLDGDGGVTFAWPLREGVQSWRISFAMTDDPSGIEEYWGYETDVPSKTLWDLVPGHTYRVLVTPSDGGEEYSVTLTLPPAQDYTDYAVAMTDAGVHFWNAGEDFFSSNHASIDGLTAEQVTQEVASGDTDFCIYSYYQSEESVGWYSTLLCVLRLPDGKTYSDYLENAEFGEGPSRCAVAITYVMQSIVESYGSIPAGEYSLDFYLDGQYLSSASFALR